VESREKSLQPGHTNSSSANRQCFDPLSTSQFLTLTVLQRHARWSWLQTELSSVLNLTLAASTREGAYLTRAPQTRQSIGSSHILSPSIPSLKSWISTMGGEESFCSVASNKPR
jgi:hypothetical protein